MKCTALCLLFLLHLSADGFAKGLELPVVSIDESVKDAFPAKPTREAVYTIRNETKSERKNPSEVSNSEGVEIITISNLAANQKKIEIESKNLKGSLQKGKKSFKIDGTSIFQTSKLSIIVDCSKSSVIKKDGFQQTLDKIEKEIKSKEVQDTLVAYLSSFVEQAPDKCKDALGPFNEANFIGKVPGSSWEENVPIKGFEKEKLNAKFLGWSKMDDKLFAVLKGTASVSSESPATSEAKSSFETISYILISSDWKIIKKMAVTNLSVSSAGEGSYSGTFKIDQTSTKVK